MSGPVFPSSASSHAPAAVRCDTSARKAQVRVSSALAVALPAALSTTRRRLLAAALAAGVAVAAPARADSTLSEASALSTLPVAVSVTAPVAIVSAGAALSVVAVEAVAGGTVWVLERASDGARASVRLAGQASAAAGTAVVVTALSTGYVLSTAAEAGSRALAFIPNEVGAALLHNERVTR